MAAEAITDWPRESWQHTFLEFSRGSAAADAAEEVAAEAPVALFSRVFTWFCGRGNSESTLFSSFHVVLWPRRLSQKWLREPWQNIFLEFSRDSVAAEAIGEVATESPPVAPRLFGLQNAHSESKLKHFLASCRKADFL